jgi:hypothetical protein
MSLPQFEILNRNSIPGVAPIRRTDAVAPAVKIIFSQD